MLGPNVVPFQASMTYDLPTYKEYVKACGYYSVRIMISKLIAISLFALYFYLFGILFPDTTKLSTFLLIALALYWVPALIQFLRGRNGGIGYQRMLSDHNGTPLHQQLTFLDEHIQLSVPFTNSTHNFPYHQVRKVFETETLIVIVLEYNRAVSFQKDSLTGGPLNTFIASLFEKCPKWKRKKLTSPLLPGKIVHGLLIAISVISLLIAIWCSEPVQEFRANHRSIHNAMSYTEIAEALEEFGIHDIPQSVIDKLESYDEEYDYIYTFETNKCLDLLCWTGMGEYNYFTGEWTPTQCGVYWFDAEVIFIDSMYTDFLLGIQALDPEALNFTDIEETVSGLGEETGWNVHSVSFTWNGQQHTLTGNSMFDWFDLDFAVQLNRILKESGKQLYFAWDQGQGYIVFYGDKAWARSFEQATGIDLNTDPTRLDALY